VRLELGKAERERHGALADAEVSERLRRIQIRRSVGGAERKDVERVEGRDHPEHRELLGVRQGSRARDP
jgi:hypothetical protein